MDLPERPFTFEQAAGLGLSPRALRDAVARGVVRRVLRGVYVDAAISDDPSLRARAASLVMPTHAVISDRSAAWLHGVDVLDPGEHHMPPLLEVVSTDADRVRRPETLGGKRQLLLRDVMTVEGVTVTTPLRTALDLGRLRGRSAAFAAMCLLVREHGITRERLVSEVPRFKGMRGVVQLRELAPLVTPKCESHRESWTLLAILDAGLPSPECQVWVEVPAYGSARLDFAYRLARIAVEYDGEDHHSSPEDRRRDELRREALRADGWTVIVVRRGELHGPALDGWLGALREALEAGRRTGPRRYARAPRLDSRQRLW
jgi:hypothetical protein